VGCAPAEEAPTPAARGPLRAPAALPTRTFAFVLVDMGGGVALTADEARGRLLDAPDSLRNHLLAATDAMVPADAALDVRIADASDDLAIEVVDARDSGDATVPRVATARGPPFSPGGAGCGCATARVAVGASREGPLADGGLVGFIVMGASVLRLRRWPMRPRR
jgi:hypothetical protein